MINCPNCQKDVSESAATCPHCGHPVAQTINAVQKQQDDQSKKKGCALFLIVIGGIILLVGGATFIGARKDADSLVQTTTETQGYEQTAANDAIAQSAGEGSFSGYLAKQNRHSGMFWIAVGGGLAVVGFGMFKGWDEKKK